MLATLISVAVLSPIFLVFIHMLIGMVVLPKITDRAHDLAFSSGVKLKWKGIPDGPYGPLLMWHRYYRDFRKALDQHALDVAELNSRETIKRLEIENRDELVRLIDADIDNDIDVRRNMVLSGALIVDDRPTLKKNRCYICASPMLSKSNTVNTVGGVSVHRSCLYSDLMQS